MRRSDLEHVIRAAADVTGDEIVVIGSQAILGGHPDAPDPLLESMEADVYPRTHPELAIDIDGAMGDGSVFHETFGYYAHGVGPETLAAPAGWQERLIRVDVPAGVGRSGGAVGWCLEAHDVVLAKLAAGRAHDREFAVRALRAGLVDPRELRRRARLMPAAVRSTTRDDLEGAIAASKRS